MTIEQVKQRIEKIKTEAGGHYFEGDDPCWDDERAHEMEDELHRDVLRAIAFGEIPDENLKEVAILALSTEQLNFSRWCA